MSPATVLLLLIGTAIATLGITLASLGRIHRHSWDEWGPWTEAIDQGRYVSAIRYRTCSNCSEVQSQAVGIHNCVHTQKGEHCRHLDHLLHPTARITNLEKELGLE